MNILVINCGSSSLKFQLIRMEDEKVLAKGLVERIGIDGSQFIYRVFNNKIIKKTIINNHKEAMQLVLNMLIDKENGVIKSINDIDAVGHRIVHGGEKYKNAVVIEENVKKDIIKCYKLAPIHNPANMMGVSACEEIMKNVKMVAVFDTSFHQTLKEQQYIYAIPYSFYKKYKIRKYGFHGISHNYVSIKIAKELNKNINQLKIISCHLGNGASICAIKNGKSFDTTMGFTPLDGLVMGTRCGCIDPSIILYLEQNGYTEKEVYDILNRKSGVLGISEISSDFRDLECEAINGNKSAKLALDVFIYSIRKNIGAYITAMEGVDIIAFTAGIGENSSFIRQKCLENLEFIGITINKEKNKVKGEFKEISADNSKVKVYVVPTNEELLIAKEVVNILK